MEENVIYTRELTKRFGTFTAVDRISFNVRRGEIFGFLGANGAGKTTAMRMLCGLSVPTAGEGRVAGFDIATEAEEVKKRIGYMSQRFSLYEDLKVWETIRSCVLCRSAGSRNSRSRSPSSTNRVLSSSTSPPEVSIPSRAASFGS